MFDQPRTQEVSVGYFQIYNLQERVLVEVFVAIKEFQEDFLGYIFMLKVP